MNLTPPMVVKSRTETDPFTTTQQHPQSRNMQSDKPHSIMPPNSGDSTSPPTAATLSAPAGANLPPKPVWIRHQLSPQVTAGFQFPGLGGIATGSPTSAISRNGAIDNKANDTGAILKDSEPAVHLPPGVLAPTQVPCITAKTSPMTPVRLTLRELYLNTDSPRIMKEVDRNTYRKEVKGKTSMLELSLSPTSSTTSSTLSENHIRRYPELLDAKAKVYHQGVCGQSFDNIVLSNIPLLLPFPEAHDIFRHLNPDYFQMPYGSRVINMKSDSLDNVTFAMRFGYWTNQPKVNERMMQVWQDRVATGHSARVYLLFSVTGTKQYCGLAEMVGPVQPNKRIRGWKKDGCEGIVPVVFLYAKNVPFTHFQNVRNERSGQSVVNMWNGMNFEQDLGRTVVERYVVFPLMRNVLVYPASEGPFMSVPFGTCIDRLAAHDTPPAKTRLPVPRSGRGSKRHDVQDNSRMQGDWRNPGQSRHNNQTTAVANTATGGDSTPKAARQILYQPESKSQGKQPAGSQQLRMTPTTQGRHRAPLVAGQSSSGSSSNDSFTSGPTYPFVACQNSVQSPSTTFSGSAQTTSPLSAFKGPGSNTNINLNGNLYIQNNNGGHLRGHNNNGRDTMHGRSALTGARNTTVASPVGPGTWSARFTNPPPSGTITPMMSPDTLNGLGGMNRLPGQQSWMRQPPALPYGPQQQATYPVKQYATMATFKPTGYEQPGNQLAGSQQLAKHRSVPSFASYMPKANAYPQNNYAMPPSAPSSAALGLMPTPTWGLGINHGFPPMPQVPTMPWTPTTPCLPATPQFPTTPRMGSHEEGELHHNTSSAQNNWSAQNTSLVQNTSSAQKTHHTPQDSMTTIKYSSFADKRSYHRMMLLKIDLEEKLAEMEVRGANDVQQFTKASDVINSQNAYETSPLRDIEPNATPVSGRANRRRYPSADAPGFSASFDARINADVNRIVGSTDGNTGIEEGVSVK